MRRVKVLTEETVCDIAAKAMEFWDYQKFTELQFVQHQSKQMRQKLSVLEKGANDRNAELQNKIAMLTHKLQSIESERQNEKKELEDLQQKYAEQSRFVFCFPLHPCFTQLHFNPLCSQHLSSDKRDAFRNCTSH